MYISPPITVLAILATGLVGSAWIEPPPSRLAQATVVLPATTYQKLELMGKAHAGADGKTLTVPQVIDALARNGDKN